MLKNSLKNDMVAAMKARDTRLVGVLRFLIAVIDKKENQLPPGEMTEVDEIAVLKKELQNKKEAREVFLRANREELVKEQDYEIEITKKYLPEEMTEVELEEMVNRAIDSVGKNFGAVMGMVMKEVAGRASGEVVSKMVREKLNG